MHFSKLALCLVASAAFSSAALMTDVAGGTTTSFTGNGECAGAGTQVVEGFSMESNGSWCYNYDGSFVFNDNGIWSGLPLVGANSGTTFITVNLGGLFFSVGGFMNYAVIDGVPVNGEPVIEALDINGDVLESYNLFTLAPITLTSGTTNGGAFRGISRDSADIAYLRFGGGYLAASSLTLDGPSGTAVPEPSTGMILGGALMALGLVKRRIGK